MLELALAHGEVAPGSSFVNLQVSGCLWGLHEAGKDGGINVWGRRLSLWLLQVTGACAPRGTTRRHWSERDGVEGRQVSASPRQEPRKPLVSYESCSCP